MTARSYPEFVAISLTTVLVTACSSAPPPPPPTPAVAPAPLAASAPVTSARLRIVPVTPSPSTLRAEPFRVLSPRPRQLLSANDVDDTPVRLALDAPDAEGSVFVALDMYPAKRWSIDTAGRLADLHPPADTLSPGYHRLVVFVGGADHQVRRTVDGSAALRAVWFAVDATPTPLPPDRSLFIAFPRGSYSGPAQASRVPLGVHVVGERTGHTSLLRVQGPGADAATAHVVEPGQPYVLENLANADYTLTVQLVDAAHRPLPGPWARAERIIIINGDAPDDSTTGTSASILSPSALPPSYPHDRTLAEHHHAPE